MATSIHPAIGSAAAIAKETAALRESVLSDFADFVDKQQLAQQFPRTPATTTDKTTGATTDNDMAGIFNEDELSIIEQLGLADEDMPRVKLKDLLLNRSEEYDELLAKEVKERLDEGRGETIFEVSAGEGDVAPFTEAEYKKAMETLTAVATTKLNCAVTALLERGAPDANGKSDGYSSIVLIRRRPASANELLEIRVAVVGNVDAGKSTMLGVLTKGVLDDGRGKSRVNLFRHKHEIESGRTSSVGMEILGFDAESHVVGSNVPGRKLTWEEIGQKSAKVISFSDLAGHEKYLRTTVFGLLGTAPDYVMLMVAANNGLIGMSKEHLGIAVALNVPVLVVITKIDMCPPNILQQTIKQLTKILKSPHARKVPIFIKSSEDVVTTAAQFVTQRICPIFQVSNVTGEGIDYVRTFLNILPFHSKFNSNAPFEFHVNDCFSVPFAGTVVSGVVKSGTVHAGDTIVIGPDGLGQFATTTIRSIQRKRLPVAVCSAGQSASFALKKVRRKDVRKGMVVLSKTETPPVSSKYFLAEILILTHSTTIKTRYQAMLHIGPVSQTCRIVDLDRDYIRAGDRATVVFEFCQRPEYISVGDKLLFREGRTKGLGYVKEINYNPENILEKKQPKFVIE